MPDGVSLHNHTAAPRSNVVALRPSNPRPAIPHDHPSVYDRTTEPRGFLAVDEVTTIPLSLTGLAWSVLWGELYSSTDPATKALGVEIGRQIRKAVEG